MTKKDFINKLIQDAQENIWKNELAIAYKELNDDKSELNIEATKEHIKRDNEYIAFLQGQLGND